jgi:protein ImuA
MDTITMADTAFNTQLFQQLQDNILQWQGMHAPLDEACPDMGLGMMSASFPHNVFPVSAVHEFVSQSRQEAAAALGFMAGLLRVLMRRGPCLWISAHRMVFPPGLKAFGLSPDQVIFVHAINNRDALWAIEEGLKNEALSAVVGEVQDLAFTASRRFQLAVEKSRVTGFIQRKLKGAGGTTACVSRWRIRPLASLTEENMPGVGFPHWRVELMKIRNGRPGSWHVQWTGKGFRVAEDTEVSTPVMIKKVV